MPKLPNAQRALKSKLNNFAGGAIGKIKNPILRGAASNLLDGIFPGLGGGTPNFLDSVFREKLRENEAALLNAATDQVGGIQITKPLGGGLKDSYDWRARLRPKAGGVERFYGQIDSGDTLLRPLKESGGIV